MFGTLRYDSDSNFTLFQSGGYTPQHSACDTCRLRKLKCGGQKKGCDRCKNSRSVCSYSDTGDGTQRRRKRAAASNNASKSTALKSPSYSTTEPRASSETSRLATSQEVSGRTTTGPEDGQEVEQVRSVSGDDMAADLLASPFLGTEEDDTISDQMLQDLMPDLGLPSIDDYFTLPGLETEAGLPRTSTYSFNLSGLPDENTPSLNATGQRNFYGQTLPTPNTTPPDFLTNAPTYSLQSGRPPPAKRRSTSQESSKGRSLSLSSTGHGSTTQIIVDKSPSQQSNGQCECLQRIVRLLEALEDTGKAMESYTLDAVLAHQKLALKHCNNMVRCLACIARSDYMMLLVIVVGKLVDSCEQVVTKLVNCFSTKVSGEAQTACEKAPKMQFGQYEIDTPTEQEYVSRVLTALQLKNVLDVLAKMLTIAASASRGSHLSALRATDQRIRGMVERLRQLEA